MRYTTDQMRDWAGPLGKLDEDCGGANVAMKEAADEIDLLRELTAWADQKPESRGAQFRALLEERSKLEASNEELIRGMTEMGERFIAAMKKAGAAGGKYRVVLGADPFNAFTDNEQTAVDIAGYFMASHVPSEVWELAPEGWWKIYPDPRPVG